MNRLLLFIPLVIFALMGLVFWVGLGIEDKTSLPSPLTSIIASRFPDVLCRSYRPGAIT